MREETQTQRFFEIENFFSIHPYFPIYLVFTWGKKRNGNLTDDL